jgi:hypothetical protein
MVKWNAPQLLGSRHAARYGCRPAAPTSRDSAAVSALACGEQDRPYHLASFAVWAKLFTDRTVPGWPSQVALGALFFGVLCIVIGMVGEYVGRTPEEVRGRPRFIISERPGLSPRDAHRTTIQHPPPETLG